MFPWTEHTVHRPISTPVGGDGERLPSQDSCTTEHLSTTRLHVISDDSAIFSIGHKEFVFGSAQGKLVGYKEGKMADGVLPCLQQLARATELEDTTITVATWKSKTDSYLAGIPTQVHVYT